MKLQNKNLIWIVSSNFYFSPIQFLYFVGVYVKQNNKTENENLIRGLRTVSGIVSYLTETQKTETLNKLQQLQTYST